MTFNIVNAELRKIKGSGFVPASFIAFALAPLMGGFFMFMLRHPHLMGQAGGLSAKAAAMNFTVSWSSYFQLLSQAIGVGGLLLFGFVASWLFGREYADGTAKDMLALPASRAAIVRGKYVVYVLWSLALASTNLLVGVIIGTMFGMPWPLGSIVISLLGHYYFTALLTMLVCTPIAFFALWGRGFITPLGFVALTLVFAQIVAAAGFGSCFPWAIPGLFSGASGTTTGLGATSYIIVAITAVSGFLATSRYWVLKDHTK